jgi:predicted ATPase/DNA-binding SARP family transcriptional activator
MVQVRLLGPVDFVDDSGTIHTVGSALRRTLLALLALRVGEVVSQDWLLEKAWNGEPPESGAPALRFHISHLRGELGESELIETHPGGYRLGLSAREVDALAMVEMVSAARLESDHLVTIDVYAQALAMWRGDPFVDAAACSTLDDEAGRLDELRDTITEGYFQARLDAGAGSELIAELSLAVKMHPLREGLWSALITAEYRAGRQADALRSYEQVRTVLRDTLGLDPSPVLQDLQRRILIQDATLDCSESARLPGGERHNLPVPPTRYIVNDDRLSALSTAVRDMPVVTLLGTGGVGKTRLALEVGWAVLGTFDDGVCLVELAPVVVEQAVLAAVATALSIAAQPGVSVLDSVVQALERRSMLLILDNCEHVIDAVAGFVAIVAARCPQVHVLATSREPLATGAERIQTVASLDPDAAVELFLDRAVAADATFLLEASDAASVVAICRTLDCIPLAVELAAARIRSMSPTELLGNLDDRFRLLRSNSRGRLDRHRTLHATVDWSYQLLSEQQRGLFNRLTSFAGGFDLAAAEAVGADDMIATADVLNLLSELVDKSMVNAERTPHGTRYHLLETMRQFGSEQLVADQSSSESAQRTATLDRHLGHYLATAEHANELFRTRAQMKGVDVFEADWGNLRVAINWAVDSGNLAAAERLALAVYLYAILYGRVEHAGWVRQILTLETDERVPSPATFGQAASWAYIENDLDSQRQLAERGIEVAPSPDDPGTALCWVLLFDFSGGVPPGRASFDVFAQELAVATVLDLDREWNLLPFIVDHSSSGDPSRSRQLLGQLVARAETVGAPALAVMAAIEQGNDCVAPLEERPSVGAGAVGSKPDFSAAFGHYRRGADIARETRARSAEAECLRGVALANVGLDPNSAAPACYEAVHELSQLFRWDTIWKAMDSVVLVLAAGGSFESAAVLLGHLDAHHPPFGLEQLCRFRERARQLIHDLPDLDRWLAHGVAWDRQQMVDHALEQLRTLAVLQSTSPGVTDSTPQ